MRLFLALVSLSAVTAALDYEAMLDKLWSDCDTDGNEKLSLDEFKTALDKLGIDGAVFNKYGHTGATSFFNALDGTNGDGALTEKELAAAITDYPDYEPILVEAFTNGAGEVPTSVPAPSKAIKDAPNSVKVSLTVDRKPNEIYPGMRRDIKAAFAKKGGVKPDAVIVMYTAIAAAASARRKLATSGTKIEAEIFVADDAAAEAALAAMPADGAAFGTDPDMKGAFAGMTVTDVETESRGIPPLPISTLIGIGVALGVVTCGLCALAVVISKGNAKKANVPRSGFCSSGCCSLYAVGPWAFGELVACAALIGCTAYLFTQMDAFTQNVIGLLETLEALKASTVPAIKDLVAQLPSAILDSIIAQKAQFSLLPFAAAAPGLVAGLLILFAGAASRAPCRPKTYCATKALAAIAFVFLLLSLILYAIFGGFALIIRFAPPVIKDQVNEILGQCKVVPASVNQLVTDNQAAVDQLKAAGQDVTDLQKELDEVTSLTLLIDSGCDYLLGFFDELVALFLPGILCVVAVVFAFYVNTHFCCAAGCISKSPKVSNKSAGKSSDRMQAV